MPNVRDDIREASIIERKPSTNMVPPHRIHERNLYFVAAFHGTHSSYSFLYCYSFEYIVHETAEVGKMHREAGAFAHFVLHIGRLVEEDDFLLDADALRLTHCRVDDVVAR